MSAEDAVLKRILAQMRDQAEYGYRCYLLIPLPDGDRLVSHYVGCDVETFGGSPASPWCPECESLPAQPSALWVPSGIGSSAYHDLSIGSSARPAALPAEQPAPQPVATLPAERPALRAPAPISPEAAEAISEPPSEPQPEPSGIRDWAFDDEDGPAEFPPGWGDWPWR